MLASNRLFSIFTTAVLAVLLSAVLMVSMSVPVQADNRTWDGGGTDGTCGGNAGDGNKWSCALNWSGDSVPGASDVAIFDGTSTKDVTIDTNVNVLGIDINAGYTGTITQGSGFTVTVGTSDFDISEGSFVGGDATIDINDAFTVSGGTFTSTSGTMTVAGAFTVSSGTFNDGGGTLTADGASATWNVVTSETFHNLTLAKNNTLSVTISSGDTLVVAGALTLTDGGINTGTLEAHGDITQASTFDGGSATIDFGDDLSTQTYTINGGTVPTIRLDSAADVNDSVTFAAAATVTNLNVTSGFSGVIPLSNPSDFTLTFTAWTQDKGSYDASAQTAWNFAGSVTIGSGASFTPPTTITATGGSTTWNVDTSETFNNLTLNKSTSSQAVSITAGDTLVVTGALTLTRGVINTGTVDTRGDITQATNFGGGTGIIDFGDDLVAQTYTVSGGTVPTIRLDSAADADDSVVINAAVTITKFEVTSSFSGSVPLVNSGNYTLSVSTWSQSGGTYDASSQTAWNVETLTIGSGAVFIPPVTVTNNLFGSIWDVDTSQTFNNLIINKILGSQSLQVPTGDTIITTGTLTLTNGSFSTSSSPTWQAEGDVTVLSTWDGGTTATLLFAGSATQTFTLTGATGLYNADISVNKAAGQVNLASDLVMDAANQDLTIIEGKFHTGGYNLTVNGTSGAFTVQDGGNFQLRGGETITLNASNPTLSTGSTITYVGDGDGAADTFTITNLKNTYHHLLINSTDGATDTFQLGTALDVNGDMTITAGTVDVVSGQNYALNVAGNWSNSGTFTARNGTVTLDGTNQSVTGSTTFYNFTKSVSSADTLTLAASATQVISNTLTLHGASGQLLSLRSSTPTTQTNINPQGSRSIQYLDVQDNNNLDATAVQCTTGCVDSLNNTNWVFPGVSLGTISGNTTEVGGTATFTLVLNSQPSANVSFNLASNDATEGTASPSTVVFTNLNWSTPQTITVTGVDDFLDDGDTLYTIVTDTMSSSDPEYSGVNPGDRSVTNVDNDTSGFTVSAVSGNTTEATGTATYTIVLTAQPTATVNLGVSSNDTTEGTVSPSTLVFTTDDWSTPHTVTVTGVNDDIDDGDIEYSLVNAAASSSDNNYNGLNPNDITTTNIDNDTSGVTASLMSGNTTEAGGTAAFTLVLTALPSGNVEINTSSDNSAEGVVTSGSTVTFTSANWSTPQTVTVTGQDDFVADGDIDYTIQVSVNVGNTADALYDAVDPNDVAAINTDNDVAGFTISAISGNTTEVSGGTATFMVSLNTQPSDDVILPLASGDTTEGTLAVTQLVFTSGDWSTPQTVTVTGVDDTEDDGDITYQIVSAAATSLDSDYTGLNPADITVINTDDDDAPQAGGGGGGGRPPLSPESDDESGSPATPSSPSSSPETSPTPTPPSSSTPQLPESSPDSAPQSSSGGDSSGPPSSGSGTSSRDAESVNSDNSQNTPDETESTAAPVGIVLIAANNVTLAQTDGRVQVLPETLTVVEVTIPTDQSVSQVVIATGDSEYTLKPTGKSNVYSGLVPTTRDNQVWNTQVSLLTGDIVTVPFTVDVRRPGFVYESVNNRQLPVSGATVTLYSESGTVWSPQGFNQSNPYTTGSDGVFSWYVPNGTYVVVARKDGYNDQSVTMVVANNILTTNIPIQRLEAPVNQADIVNSPQAEIVAAVSLPLAVTASVGSVGLLTVAFNLWSYLQYLLTAPALLFNRRRRQAFGVVYNAVTKVPIEFAIVRLYSLPEHKLVKSTMAGPGGKYFMLATPGKYRLEVTKFGFAYPSRYADGLKTDGKFLDVYHGQDLVVTADKANIAANIPLDPESIPTQSTRGKLLFKKFLRSCQIALSVTGLAFSGMAFSLNPNVMSAIVVGAQLVIFGLVWRLARAKKPQSWGVVYDQNTRQPLAQTVIRLFEPKYNKLIESTLTDNRGRYSFFIGPNEYYATFVKDGYQEKTVQPIDTHQQIEPSPYATNVGLEPVTGNGVSTDV